MQQALSLSTKLLVAEEDGNLNRSTFEGVGENGKGGQVNVVETWVGKKDNTTIDFERRSTFISYLRQRYPEEIVTLVPLQYYSYEQI